MATFENVPSVLVTPQDRQADCYCRGGNWTNMEDIEHSYCTPAFPPSGKHYSPPDRGCVPNIPGQDLPDVSATKRTPAADFYARNKWWFWGIFAAGLIGYLWYTRDKKLKQDKPDKPETKDDYKI